MSVHAKDVDAVALDYPLLFELLATIAPVPLIVQDAGEADALRVRQELLRWDELA